MPAAVPPARNTQLQGITDLTVLADIRPGLIEGVFDSRSYVWRLQTVLQLLDSARRASRESDPMPSQLIDIVARLRGIQFFHFAIVPVPPSPGPYRLLLGVTFDGGWEQYMRLIWRPLGTLLDLIFCHCPGYPLAAACDFDEYVAWVRAHEVPSEFFYSYGGGTVADRDYLEQLEMQLRANGNRKVADLQATQLALGPVPLPQPTQAAVLASLRILKGLFSLSPYFGGTIATGQTSTVPTDDANVLLRFAQDLLPDLREWFAQGLFDPGQAYDFLRPMFEQERSWLMTRHWVRPARVDAEPPLKANLPARVQAGILQQLRPAGGGAMRGAVILARVTNAVDARRWLSDAVQVVSGTPALIVDGTLATLSDTTVQCTVAITCPGLAALEVDAQRVEGLPLEFRQGMEARSGTLGDLRGNHPLQWTRPNALNVSGMSPASLPVDLSTVHLMIQLRTMESPGEEADVTQGRSDRSAMLPRLQTWLTTNLTSTSGIEVLAIEPGWSRPVRQGEVAPRNHYDYVDGVSQPSLQPTPSSQQWDDYVKAGELLLGWVNDRGDGPLANESSKTPGWLLDGTFVVLRKIRQFTQRLDSIVEQTAGELVAGGVVTQLPIAKELVRAKLMGRSSDGSPLMPRTGPTPNDFDYRNDADAARCPFASHVRRGNPRAMLAGGMRPPRIMRRGMGYGPEPAAGAAADAERGVLFIAYNSSIAEQFEILQRWMAGANSSGVSSSQADPFVGVPIAGVSSVFRFTHDQHVVRVDLGDQPMTQLQYGLYAFVPSLASLRNIQDWTQPVPANGVLGRAVVKAPSPTLPVPTTMDALKLAFEDDTDRGAYWSDVRRARGIKTYTVTDGNGVQSNQVAVGGRGLVQEVLGDNGARFSAAGYGDRMKLTLGSCPYGRDDAGAFPGHAQAVVAQVKAAIRDAISRQAAYDTTFKLVSDYLATQLLGAHALMGQTEAPIDIVDLGLRLIGDLLRQWFGADIGVGLAASGPSRGQTNPGSYPQNFLSLAHYIFSAQPNDTVRDQARSQGPLLQASVNDWIAAARKNPGQAVLMDAILKVLTTSSSQNDALVANTILGLPPTLLGSLAKLIVRCGSIDGNLWTLQQALCVNGLRPDFATSDSILREPLLRALVADPVADGIWRTVQQPTELGGASLGTGDIVWLGLGSAWLDEPNLAPTHAEDFLFGGSMQPGTSWPTTPHACPGRDLAMGVMLGAFAALLTAGRWVATPYYTVLMLRSFQDPRALRG